MKIGDKNYLCTLDYAIELIKGKWKALIICHLNDSSCRFLELQKRLPGISQKVLAEKLGELVSDKLLLKNVLSHTPPNVQYKLSEEGFKLLQIIKLLESWSKEYISKRFN